MTTTLWLIHYVPQFTCTCSSAWTRCWRATKNSPVHAVSLYKNLTKGANKSNIVIKPHHNIWIGKDIGHVQSTFPLNSFARESTEMPINESTSFITVVLIAHTRRQVHSVMNMRWWCKRRGVRGRLIELDRISRLKMWWHILCIFEIKSRRVWRCALFYIMSCNIPITRVIKVDMTFYLVAQVIWNEIGSIK